MFQNKYKTIHANNRLIFGKLSCIPPPLNMKQYKKEKPNGTHLTTAVICIYISWRQKVNRRVGIINRRGNKIVNLAIPARWRRTHKNRILPRPLGIFTTLTARIEHINIGLLKIWKRYNQTKKKN